MAVPLEKWVRRQMKFHYNFSFYTNIIIFIYFSKKQAKNLLCIFCEVTHLQNQLNINAVCRHIIYLRFCEHEGRGHFKALRSWQVLIQFELMLQLQQLLACECSSGSPALAKQVGLRLSCRKKTASISFTWRGFTGIPDTKTGSNNVNISSQFMAINDNKIMII